MLRWKKTDRKVGVFDKYFSTVKKQIDEEERDSEQILKEDETKT